jgi:hypothetical protein
MAELSVWMITGARRGIGTTSAGRIGGTAARLELGAGAAVVGGERGR